MSSDNDWESIGETYKIAFSSTGQFFTGQVRLSSYLDFLEDAARIVLGLENLFFKFGHHKAELTEENFDEFVDIALKKLGKGDKVPVFFTNEAGRQNLQDGKIFSDIFNDY